MEDNKNAEIKSLIPIPRWNEKHQYPSERQLRWLVFSNPNEFCRCVVRVGRRVLIDEIEFFRWIEKQSISKN